jgi:hypothetical protein
MDKFASADGDREEDGLPHAAAKATEAAASEATEAAAATPRGTITRQSPNSVLFRTARVCILSTVVGLLAGGHNRRFARRLFLPNELKQTSQHVARLLLA